tara:strand:+ start:41685 stop:43211 length:1527 start_codon:yes stop_codon:yes gene_type:complete
MWDGAYRINLGLKPYADFGIPVGPVSFYLPALFFKLFGSNFLSLQISQLFVNFCLTFTAWKIIKKIVVNSYQFYICIFLYIFNYIILLSHPWYNITAVLFYLLSLLMVLQKNKYTNFFAGLFTIICLFTKQDYGLMSIFTSSMVILFSISNKAGILELFIVKDFKSFFNRIKSKEFIFFISGFIIGLLFFIIFYNLNDILYWFNLGQLHHTSKRPGFTRTSQTPQFYLSLICLFFSLRKKDLSLLISFLVLITSVVCSQISGLDYTAGFFVFVIPLVFFKFKDYLFIKNRFFSFMSIVLLSLASVSNNSLRAFQVFKGYISGKYEPFTMESEDFKSSSVGFESCYDEFKGNYVPSSVCTQLKLVKSNLNQLNKKDYLFLNMSELTMLHSIFDAKYPNKLPLWFHENVTLFEREKNIIINSIKNSEYKLIALQATHDKWEGFYDVALKEINTNQDYREIGDRLFISAYGVLENKEEDKKCKEVITDAKFRFLACERDLKPIRFFMIDKS